MRVLLLFPPGWMPYAPYLALPRLTAYLREQGHEVVQRDLNVELYDLVLRPEFLQTALDEFRQKYDGMVSHPSLPASEARRLQMLRDSGDRLVSRVEELVQTIRSPRFYDDPVTTIQTMRLLTTCLGLAVAPHYPARWSLHDDMTTFATFGTQDTIHAITDEHLNFTRPMMREHFLDSLLEAEPDLVGISLSCYRQTVPGLTLASLIRERRPDVPVVLGGSTATRLVDAFTSRSDFFFDLFDSVVVGEGELALEGLIEALEGERALANVPGLVYRDAEGEVQRNPMALPDLNALPTPDFDGLPLDKYLAPELVLPISSSRGCHWGKCTFCERGVAGEVVYQFRRDELVIEDIRRLQDRYGTRYFEFNEDDIPPRRLERLAEKILAAGLDVEWFAMARLEKRMTPQVCETIHRAGCRVLHYGLESGTQRVLDLMNKGIRLEQAEEVLRNSGEAGMWNSCFLIVGFPTEEAHEVQNTVAFVTRSREHIHAVEFNSFHLTKFTEVSRRPEDFGVELVERPDLEFLWTYGYVPRRGLTMSEADGMTEWCWNQIREDYPNHEIWKTLPWEPLFLYICARGRDYVQNVVLPPPFEERNWQERTARLHWGLTLQPADGRTVLADLATGKRFALQPAALRFLELCQGGMPVGEAVEAMAAAEELPVEVAEQRCLGVLKALSARGGIEWA